LGGQIFIIDNLFLILLIKMLKFILLLLAILLLNPFLLRYPCYYSDLIASLFHDILNLHNCKTSLLISAADCLFHLLISSRASIFLFMLDCLCYILFIYIFFLLKTFLFTFSPLYPTVTTR